VTHDYETHVGAIPLPVTLTMLLGSVSVPMRPEPRSGCTVPIHFLRGARRVVCTMPLARQPGTIYSTTPPRPSTVLRMSKVAVVALCDSGLDAPQLC